MWAEWYKKLADGAIQLANLAFFGGFFGPLVLWEVGRLAEPWTVFGGCILGVTCYWIAWIFVMEAARQP
jgi:hypothetical protein